MKMLAERHELRSPARKGRGSSATSAHSRSRFSGRWLLAAFSVACAFLLATSARAQWQSTTYALKGGWNAIYLHGDASYATIDALVASRPEVVSVWRWNPNPTQTQFNSSPLIPTAGTPEWSIWRRGGTANSLLSLSGPAAYLVECSGTAADSYQLAFVQKAAPPRATWVRNGANLLGFPAQPGSANALFSKYFATFPVAIATNTKIYKYDGGPLGPSNPVQVFSPAAEPLNRTQAYWFEASVVSDFYAPLEISPSNPEGLVYGRTGSLITVRVRNRTAAGVTLTASPVDSVAAPAGQDQVAGRVPLTYRSFNPTTNAYEFRAVTAGDPVSVVVGPQSSVELSFGVDRTQIAGAPDTLYASLLRFTDSPAAGNLMEVFLPVSARVASLSGLWVGDVTVTNVANRVPSQNFTVDITRTTGSIVTLSGGGGSGAEALISSISSFGVVTGLTLTQAGSGYATAPTVTLSGGGGFGAAATAVGSSAAGLTFSITNPGSGYTSAPTVTITGGGGSGATATASVTPTGIAGMGVATGGAGYTSAPAVSISGGSGAVVTARINGVIAVTVTNGGSGYTAVPNVIFDGGGGSGAAAVATVVDKRVVAVTIANSGAGYTSAPNISFADGGGTGAVATANISTGSVTGFMVSTPGTGYTPRVVTTEAGVRGVGSASSTLVPARLPNGTGGTLTYQWKKNGQPLAGATSSTLVLGADEALASGAFGTGTARPFTLRTLIHVADDGTVRLLPHAFLGKLKAAPNNLGLSTSEALLLPSALATARRFSTVHLPPEVESISGTGAFAPGQSLVCTVPLAHDAATNPFVHTYHPDHDNRNARFDAALPAGIESPAISRALRFDFASTPPAGAGALGWGSAVITGTYEETVTGIHKTPITVSGTFQLRRVVELGSLTTN